MAKRRIAAVASMIALVVAGLGVTSASAAPEPAAPAPAELRIMNELDGVCDRNEVCFYYNSNWQGSVADFNSSVSDFAGYEFVGLGAGKGQQVKNNAASVCNYFRYYVAVVYYNSWYAGRADVIPPQECENLKITYNENASVKMSAI